MLRLQHRPAREKKVQECGTPCAGFLRDMAEHVFARVSHMCGKSVRRIVQARSSAAMTMMATCYKLKRLASFLDRGVDSFFKPAPSKRQLCLQRAKV